MAGDIRAHLRTTAEGYLFLKGAAGATLIQMKAAKLFKACDQSIEPERGADARKRLLGVEAC